MITRGRENKEIVHNTFRGNSRAIVLRFGRTLPMPVDIRIMSNNFIDSTYEHLRTHEYITSDIIATGNWLGITDESEIQRLIFDYYNALKLPEVIWQPFKLAKAFLHRPKGARALLAQELGTKIL